MRDERGRLGPGIREACELPYRNVFGCDAKNCKGVYKSILNRCLIEKWNQDAGEEKFFLSSEDLTNVGVLPLQEDLATITALGINHTERNGHHYFRGLEHLSESERRSVLEHHPDLYVESDGLLALAIRDGKIQCGSLQAPGYGYSCDIDFESRMTLDEWRATR